VPIPEKLVEQLVIRQTIAVSSPYVRRTLSPAKTHMYYLGNSGADLGESEELTIK
jgi:hypothetical protein